MQEIDKVQADRAKENAVKLAQVIRAIQLSWMREEVKLPPSLGMTVCDLADKVFKGK